jgi:hypothetical protein
MKIIKERPMATMIRMVFMFDLLFGPGGQAEGTPPIEGHLLSTT